MDVGAISAICFTVFGICCTVGTVGIVLYRRRFLNKPQALSEPDSSVYIDDSTMRVSVSTVRTTSFFSTLISYFLENFKLNKFLIYSFRIIPMKCIAWIMIHFWIRWRPWQYKTIGPILLNIQSFKTKSPYKKFLIVTQY